MAPIDRCAPSDHQQTHTELAGPVETSSRLLHYCTVFTLSKNVSMKNPFGFFWSRSLKNSEEAEMLMAFETCVSVGFMTV